MNNYPGELTYTFGNRQKLYLPGFAIKSDSGVIAGPGRMVQFYDEKDSLANTLHDFVGTGLQAGHTCIFIATKEHIAALENRLADVINHPATDSIGRYIALDVHDTIDRTSIKGEPDWKRFMDVIGSLLGETVKQGHLVRVYGEMVHILSQQGKPEAARQVERYWNDIATIYPFFLYNAYPAYQNADVKPGNNSLDVAGSLQSEIQHRKETEAALEQLEARTTGLLAEREHLMELNNAKDEFISLASHQLRTPATGVKQYIGMLLQGFIGDLTDAQRNSLVKAYESNERQLKIVNDLLLVARVDAGKMTINKQPCDVVQLIRDVACEQEEAISMRKQTIDLHLPKSLHIHIDARYVRMVVENLINNASKYSGDGLPIRVSARRRDGMAIINVKDMGVGISKHDLPKLYQKFSRIYNDRSTVVDGTGLGLYWSKRIIELHGGTLNVVSRLGRGSNFAIGLPLSTTM